jgi:DNA (cytosine-5)-methyltransferase 1
MTKPFTFVSLFSGCGGLDLGFEQAGFRGLAAFDIDRVAVESHNRNLQTPGHVCDLASEFQIKTTIAPPTVVVAGPPCQGFSTLGLRRFDDPRNSLIVVGVRHALALQPKVIIIENVSGVLSGEHRSYWEEAEMLLKSAMYSIETHKVTSSDFGVPQIRRRIVMIAWKGKEEFRPVFQTADRMTLANALEKTDGLRNHDPKELQKGSSDFKIACRIGQHQKLCNVRCGERAIPTWEIPEVFGKTTSAEREVLHAIQRLRRQLRDRESGDADPVSARDVADRCGRDVKAQIVGLCEKQYLRRIGRRFDLAHTFNGKYRRLAWEHPAPAVDTRFGEPRYFLHPEEHRGFSVREAARIQGFPDDFEFLGSRAAQFRMVGNAVPPPLAFQIAVAIREQLL